MDPGERCGGSVDRALAVEKVRFWISSKIEPKGTSLVVQGWLRPAFPTL